MPCEDWSRDPGLSCSEVKFGGTFEQTECASQQEERKFISQKGNN